jgi:hypothetical protein
MNGPSQDSTSTAPEPNSRTSFCLGVERARCISARHQLGILGTCLGLRKEEATDAEHTTSFGDHFLGIISARIEDDASTPIRRAPGGNLAAKPQWLQPTSSPGARPSSTKRPALSSEPSSATTRDGFHQVFDAGQCDARMAPVSLGSDSGPSGGTR